MKLPSLAVNFIFTFTQADYVDSWWEVGTHQNHCILFQNCKTQPEQGQLQITKLGMMPFN